MNIDDQDWEEYFRRKAWPVRVRTAVAHVFKPLRKWAKRYRFHSHVAPYALCAGLAALIVFALLLAPPLHFPDSALVKVQKGATIDEVAQILSDKNIVHSAFLFKILARLHGGIIAGEYSFTEHENVLKVAGRLAAGEYELTPVRVTVWDGATSADIAKLLSEKLPDFDTDAFYALASKEEGKLFPDTYFFYPGDEPDIVVDAMVNNFNKQMQSVDVSLAIAQFGMPLGDVLTMASILEREAGDMQNRRIIAGILWNRIKNGMPLQVDAAFLYINGKNTFELSKDDLAADSPYNTYTNKGLPPGPIGNPSIDAIIAAATPIKTDYVYYLSDMTGILHYSKTYDEHLSVKAKYLDN